MAINGFSFPSISMHNLLNWGTLYRGYNALVASLVLFQYTQDPKASTIEYIPDVLIHSFEAIAPNSLKSLATGANLGRGAMAGYAFFKGTPPSTIPQALNGLDVGNHILNLYHRGAIGDAMDSLNSALENVNDFFQERLGIEIMPG